MIDALLLILLFAAIVALPEVAWCVYQHVAERAARERAKDR